MGTREQWVLYHKSYVQLQRVSGLGWECIGDKLCPEKASVEPDALIPESGLEQSLMPRGDA